jgi:leader peptidase (prepilin peptidase)/N-methyltransferase
MNLGAGVVAGTLGVAVGAFATDFALAVPADGPLPRLSLLLFKDQQRASATLAGAALSSLVSMILGAVLGFSLVMPAYWICGLLSVALTIVDLRVHRLPYAMTGAMYVSCAVTFGIAVAVNDEGGPLIRAGVAAALALAGFLVLALALPGQLGLGDVVLIGWIAFSLAWFSWRAAAAGLLVGLTGQAIVGVSLLVRSARRRRLPMGPALLLGWLMGVVVAVL